MVHADLMRLGTQNKFNSLEKPKQLHLILEPWTVETDILTPTMKLKRNIAKNMYKDVIDELYNKPVLGKK